MNTLSEYPESPIETALVFDTQGRTLHWHLPPGRSGGYLPDSQDLWDVLWRHRLKGDGDGQLGGVAHTHPWVGRSGYSHTDVTTFSAVENGLGQRLLWPIATFDDIRWFTWVGPESFQYSEVPPPFQLKDLSKLRLLSGGSR